VTRVAKDEIPLAGRWRAAAMEEGTGEEVTIAEEAALVGTALHLRLCRSAVCLGLERVKEVYCHLTREERQQLALWLSQGMPEDCTNTAEERPSSPGSGHQGSERPDTGGRQQCPCFRRPAAYNVVTGVVVYLTLAPLNNLF
jgi:hypothetical protein